MMNQMILHQNMTEAEHLVEKWAKDWPHSYMADACKSVLSLYTKNTDNAWKDYERARSRSIQTSPWSSWIIRAAARNNDLEFAQRLYETERLVGTLETSSWLEELTDLYLDEKEAENQKIQPTDWAKQGMVFIEKLIPASGNIVRNNDHLRLKMFRLAIKSERIDWIQRLSASVL